MHPLRFSDPDGQRFIRAPSAVHSGGQKLHGWRTIFDKLASDPDIEVTFQGRPTYGSADESIVGSRGRGIHTLGRMLDQTMQG
jgi:hypothetical protein